MSITPPTSRLAPCPCGSKKRYKDCHGAIQSTASTTNDALNTALTVALEAQRAGKLSEAANKYVDALAIEPNHFDATHMLGVVRMEQRQFKAALELLIRAADATGWENLSVEHNLTLAISRVLMPNMQFYGYGTYGEAYKNEVEHKPVDVALRATTPFVSMVLTSHNNGAYIDSAIASTLSQTYQNWELIVIDDGSTDDSPARLAQLAARNDPRIKVLCRSTRGAFNTLNEAISMASGSWIQLLNGEDLLTPNHLELMVSKVSHSGARWGFAAVRCIDKHSVRIDEMINEQARQFRIMQCELPFLETLSLSFFLQNAAIAPGNLFFEKSLFNEMGGFKALRYHYDWDFCLSASRIAEPRYVDAPSYFYRCYSERTASKSDQHQQTELDAMLQQHINIALSSVADNPWMPSLEKWGHRLYALLLGRGFGRLINPPHLRHAAEIAQAMS